MTDKSKAEHSRSCSRNENEDMTLSTIAIKIIEMIENYIENHHGKKGYKIHLIPSNVLTKNDGVANVFYTENRAYIMYAQELSEEESIFPIAHELGHFVLHFMDSSENQIAKIKKQKEQLIHELEASYFARSIIQKCYGSKKLKSFLKTSPFSVFDWEKSCKLFRHLYKRDERIENKRYIDTKVELICRQPNRRLTPLHPPMLRHIKSASLNRHFQPQFPPKSAAYTAFSDLFSDFFEELHPVPFC
ncbi:MAG: ImmA/IrrE family metallo-endopeptidase [Oscillospiraceae bacterium]|nr:ImmA/IrrE family metallo-endopeptidase [Oscillospiraceae bacterium]